MTTDPTVLWRQADRLKNRARLLRNDADALDRAAERLSRMAAALADDRDADLVAIALEVGRK